MEDLYYAKATKFFVVRTVGRIIAAWSGGKIIILCFRVSTSKNNNKKKSIIEVIVKVTTSLYSVIQRCKFVKFLFYCNLKEKDHVRKKRNSKKNICEISIIIILICRKLRSVWPVQQEIKLPLPYLKTGLNVTNLNLDSTMTYTYFLKN